MNRLTKIIAVATFMGYTESGDPPYLTHPDTDVEHNVDSEDWFLYDKSWDWLMVVVERIESLGFDFVVETRNGDLFKSGTNPKTSLVSFMHAIKSYDFLISMTTGGNSLTVCSEYYENTAGKMQAIFNLILKFIEWKKEQ